MTIEQLEDAKMQAKKDADNYVYELIKDELLERHLKSIKKPHWTITPVFWVSVVAALAACIAAVPVVRDWVSATKSLPQLPALQPEPQAKDKK